MKFGEIIEGLYNESKAYTRRDIDYIIYIDTFDFLVCRHWDRGSNNQSILYVLSKYDLMADNWEEADK